MPKGTPLTKFAPICSVDDCGRPVKAYGRCRPHHRAWVRDHGPMPKVEYPDTCTIENCGKPFCAKGLCSAHLRRLRLYGDPLAPRPRPNVSRFCTIEDCGDPVHGHGYCVRHWGKWKRYGNPLAVCTTRLPQVGPCSEVGCDRPSFSRGLCKYHYHRTYIAPKQRAKAAAERSLLPPRQLDTRGWRRRIPASLEDRIEQALTKIDRNGPFPVWRSDLDRCHVWTASTTTGGHVQLVVGGTKEPKRYQLHRLMWEREVGPIPEGLVVDHLCRIGRCQNVTHFELVTPHENNRRGIECARCLFFRVCPDCGTDLREHGRVAPPPPQIKLGRVDSLTMEERFNLFAVEGPVSPFVGTPCLDWAGPRNECEYGYMPNKGSPGPRKMSAHRFGYELVNGLIPEGLTIDHLCRRPCCVRGDGHLEAVTQSENSHRRHDCTRCILLRECPSCHLDIASVTSADRWRAAA